VIVAGANLFLGPEDLVCVEEALASSKVLVCQLEVRPETTTQALRYARRHGGEYKLLSFNWSFRMLMDSAMQ